MSELPLTEVEIQTGDATLTGDLAVPPGAKGLVVFAHGSGSSRFSSRNRFVAESLNQAGLATLLFDLLTDEEQEIDSRTRHLRFDIELLARRMTGTVDWVKQNPQTAELKIGLFGASTGAAGALVTAAERPEKVTAIVSRGGRPDLAGHSLEHVQAPTLLIVGGNDVPVIGMNREAAEQMEAAHVQIDIVPGASHLFEEPGRLEEVAELARDWFKQYLEDAQS
ncbi:MAG: dienelactone hydrolase family protein [Phycisphaeraceae bacterium]